MIDAPLIDSSFIMRRGVNETSAHQLFSEVAAQAMTLINRREEGGNVQWLWRSEAMAGKEHFKMRFA